MSEKKSTGRPLPAPVRELWLEAPRRLRTLFEHVGVRVRLVFDRLDGRELGGVDQEAIPAVVKAYESEEVWPEVTAADVDIIEALEALAKEEEASAKKTAPPSAEDQKPS